MYRSPNSPAWWLRSLFSGLSGRLSCREFRTFILQYFEGELSTREAWTFERHLRVCPECLTYLTAYGTSMAMGAVSNRPPEAPVPDSVPENLVVAIEAVRTKPGG